jgi:alpha-tubulin suppressor-like RCC1 family protein
MRLLQLCLGAVAATTLSACPSEVPDQQNFAGVDILGGADTNADIAAADQASGLDQSANDADDGQTLADTAVTDGGQVDKDQVDINLVDTTQPDTAKPDTAQPDTSPKDTAPADTGAPQTCANASSCTGETGPCQGWQCSGGSCYPLLKNSGPCEDGNACTSDDVCFAGSCQAGGQSNCDDNNPCTSDGCNSSAGCSHTQLKEGSDCGGGKTCTNGSCGGGVASGVTWVGAGGDESCAVVNKDGKVFCWGDDKSGQLGGGSTQGKWATSPQAVVNLAGANQVDCGGNHCCAVTSTGLYCWGNNEFGQITATGAPPAGQAKPMPTPYKVLQPAAQVAVGLNHTCARDAGGTVRCWGLAANGELGEVSQTTGSAAVVAKIGASAIDLDCGNNFCCAVVSGGGVSCWGVNGNGQIGLGYSNSANTPPTLAKGVSGASQIATGSDHACAVVGGGKVMCWGANNAQQTGRSGSSMGQLTPASVPSINGASQIAAGGAHTCAWVGGKVMCWGDNGKRQSAPASAAIYVLTPTEITGLPNPSSMALGDQHSCVRTTAGELYCWGGNNLGQIGNGSTKDVVAPLLVQ